MKKLLCVLLAILLIPTTLAFGGCDNSSENETKDFAFTEEVIAKIGDDELAKELIDYCNEFYRHFQVECEQKLYIENDKISSTVATNLQDKIYKKAPSIDDFEGSRDFLGFYMPFLSLWSARAEEYLGIVYDWVWVNGELTKTNPSPLTQTYIDEVNHQFEILKTDYFVK